MPQTGKSFQQLPSPVELALRELGEAIRVARLRRRQSAQDFASRLGVTQPTGNRCAGEYDRCNPSASAHKESETWCTRQTLRCLSTPGFPMGQQNLSATTGTGSGRWIAISE